MVRIGRGRGAVAPGAVDRVPMTSAETERAVAARWRIRPVAGFRPSRLLLAGGLLVAGWILGIVFALLGASPAAAETHAGTQAVEPVVAAEAALSSVSPGEDALAMAGSHVEGLTSQSTPQSPVSAADRHQGTVGFVPQSGGGAGPSASGEAVWYDHAPRTGAALRVPMPVVPDPVVRTAADDPSFSPD